MNKNNIADHEGIAVIGMACRFPGRANTPEGLWQLLQKAEVAIRDVPDTRWDQRHFYHSSLNGRVHANQAGFLEEDISLFDAEFFNISPREAAEIDPQQRMMMEITQEVLEDAGIPASKTRGSNTGVFVGTFAMDSLMLRMSPLNRRNITQNTATSSSMTILSARLAYVYDWRGPCFTLDTACSSSLVAIHCACQSLRNNECELAVAGGANVMLIPEMPAIMSEGGFLSSDSRCRSFDNDGKGYVRGEGAGILLLKPLKQAIADNNKIHAVILGTGINQDGRTDGMTVPSAEAQKKLIVEVQKKSNVTPDDIIYVEAHGTGTPVGDPIEAAAIGETIGSKRTIDEPLVIGSIKANVGHLEGAAGVAGVIRAILCLKHSEAPANPLFKTPNKNIDFKKLKLKVSDKALQLKKITARAVAAVNSFGYGGTNAHALVECYQTDSRDKQQENASQPLSDDYPRLIPFSAKSPEALKKLQLRYAAYLHENADITLDQLSYNLAKHRDHYQDRDCYVVNDREELLKILTGKVDENNQHQLVSGSKIDAKEITFVYTGMGPQWPEMAKDLIAREPVFENVIKECDRYLQRVTDMSIMENILLPEEDSQIHATQITQPCIFAVQAALTELFKSWGIVPSMVIGHSIGEIGAAYASGALSLEDGVITSYHRSKIQATKAGQGTMLAASISEKTAASLIKDYPGKIDIGAINGSESLTLSGEVESLQKIADYLTEKNIFNRMLTVEIAYHSQQLADLESDVKKALHTLSPKRPTIPIVSTVTGLLANDVKFDGDYWWENIIKPVRFHKAMNTLFENNQNLFVEIGPHPVLANAIKTAMLEKNIEGCSLASLKRNENGHFCLMATLAGLHCSGIDLPWELLARGKHTQLKLPYYTFNRQKYWTESTISQSDHFGDNKHAMVYKNIHELNSTYETYLLDSLFPYLRDHALDGVPVIAGAFYIEAALQVHWKIYEKNSCSLEKFRFTLPCIISDDEVRFRSSLNQRTGKIKFYSCNRLSDEWDCNAQSKIYEDMIKPMMTHVNLDEIRLRCTQESASKDFYQHAHSQGMHYGECFQAIQKIWRSKDGKETLAELNCPLQSDDLTLLHPTLLDGAFQTLLSNVSSMVMVAEVGRVTYIEKPPVRVLVHAQLTHVYHNRFIGDLKIIDEKGKVYVEIKDLLIRLIAKGKEVDEDLINQSVYCYEWEQAEQVTDKKSTIEIPTWMVLCGDETISMEIKSYYEAQSQHKELFSYDINSSREAMLTQFSDQLETLIRKKEAITIIMCLGKSKNQQDLIKSTSRYASIVFCIAKTLIQNVSEIPMRFYLVTENGQDISMDINLNLEMSGAIGVTRVLQNECQGLAVKMIDVEHFKETMVEGLMNEILYGDEHDEEVALRQNNKKYIRKITRSSWGDNLKDAGASKTAKEVDNYCLDFKTIGLIDSLYCHEIPRKEIKSDELEVKAHTASINFKDLMKLMGMIDVKAIEDSYFGDGFGMEISGVVTRVGEDIKKVKVGDEVCWPNKNAFQKYLVGKETYCPMRLPGCTMEEAPVYIPFMTVVYGLKQLAQLTKDDVIFIPSATGAVGLAAIQYARSIGSTIIVAAGTPEKRDYLSALGIKHVTNSRVVDFGDDIMRWTNGRGVDVVFNSMPGNLLFKAWDILAPYGRFIEIGKRDITENNGLPMEKFNQNAMFAALDLDHVLKHNEKLGVEIIRETYELFEQNVFQALPTKVYELEDSNKAFNLVARGKHIGKVHIKFLDSEIPIAIDKYSAHHLLKSDGLYIISGGFGGLGLTIAEWLSNSGANQLLLLGRSGATTNVAKEKVKMMEGKGTTILTGSVDVSDYDALRKIIQSVNREGIKVRGIFHCAAVLKDGLIQDLTEKDFSHALPAKMVGAWNFHRLSQELQWQLDHFVLMSSFTAMVGNQGQSNYVAANTFLEQLAVLRQSQGLPAVAINWGALKEVGMAARDQQTLSYLESTGIYAFNNREAMMLLGLVMISKPSVLGVLFVDWDKWAETVPRIRKSSKYSSIVSKKKINKLLTHSDVKAIVELPEEEHHDAMQNGVIEVVSHVVKLHPDKLSADKSLKNLGLDSLMAVEMQQVFKRKYGVEYPTMEALKGPKISEIASYILTRIHESLAEGGEETGNVVELEVDTMSEEELDKLLQEQTSEGKDNEE